MKTILTFLLLFCASLRAVEVEFVWNAAPAEDEVTGYSIWKRMPDNTVVKLATFGAVTSGIVNLDSGKYSVFLTSFSLPELHSPPSDPVSFTVPAKPQGFRIKVALQTTDTPDIEASWKTVAVHFEEGAAQRQFYRLAFQTQ